MSIVLSDNHYHPSSFSIHHHLPLLDISISLYRASRRVTATLCDPYFILSLLVFDACSQALLSFGLILHETYVSILRFVLFSL